MKRFISEYGVIAWIGCIVLIACSLNGDSKAHAPTMKADTVPVKSFLDSIREDSKWWYDRRKKRIIKDYDTEY